MVDRRAKKAEKRRKKRDAARRSGMQRTAHGSSAPGAGATAALISQAASCPVGQCYVSGDWDDTSSPMAPLVTVVVPRRLPTGHVLAGVAMVDRTCLGIKNAFFTRPLSPGEYERLILEKMGGPHDGMVPCDLLTAQSVVYHAIDYAHRLGFEPYADFPEGLFGPRPAELIETPLCNAPKPNYVSGPDDDVPAILARLDHAVGRDNYHFTVAAEQFGVGGGAQLLIGGEEDGEDQGEDGCDDDG
ncbi:MAG: hypothetical protein JXB32_10280 [Deltaproteobacteria bacterium]|nr:hypothetical protein [Deltaproteobacteria bacterium]